MKKKNRFILYAVLAVIVIFAVIFGVTFYLSKHSSKKEVSGAKISRVNSSISISPAGAARISNVAIASINSGTITATGTISEAPATFTVKTDRGTIVHKGNATSSVSALTIGDVFTVTGTLETLSPFTVVADDIRVSGTYVGPRPGLTASTTFQRATTTKPVIQPKKLATTTSTTVKP